MYISIEKNSKLCVHLLYSNSTTQLSVATLKQGWLWRGWAGWAITFSTFHSPFHNNIVIKLNEIIKVIVINYGTQSHFILQEVTVFLKLAISSEDNLLVLVRMLVFVTHISNQIDPGGAAAKIQKAKHSDSAFVSAK